MRTEHELRKKLIDKGVNEDLCDKTIAFLKEYNYINDTEYARLYINDAFNNKKHGIRRILNDLRHKGIDENILEDVLADLELDFKSNLASLIRAHAKNIDLASPKDKNRLVGYLMRRGYNLNDIFAGIREYMEEMND
jgi:regulatory protein